ncbi:RNA polymerase sigma factor [Kiritimatiellota bacterium B12222]|nr:RNA polymerase sigma factor [Kiritimatiellota bacterium B12222]
MDSIDPDLEALRLMQQGEEQGLLMMMSRHREGLYRFVYRFVRNQEDANELTEQCFLRVFQHASRFKPKAKVSTWMYSIAGNLCRDFLRKNKKRKDECSLDQPLGAEKKFRLLDIVEAEAPTPEAAAMTRESLLIIESAIDALPHRLKVPFIFCVLEDHSYDACADLLKTNRKAVETRIYRARKLLREQLG